MECAICRGRLDRLDLAAAMYEGQVVRDTLNQPWAGQSVCSRCFSLVEMGQLALYQIRQMAAELGWSLKYAIWLFNLTLSGQVVSSGDGVYLIQLDEIPWPIQVVGEAREGQRLRIRSQSGVWVTGQSAAPREG